MKAVPVAVFWSFQQDVGDYYTLKKGKRYVLTGKETAYNRERDGT